MSSITIRPLREADSPAWHALWSGYNAFYARSIPDDVTATTFARLLDPNVRMYAAVAVHSAPAQSPLSLPPRIPEKVVGFVHWYPHPSTSSVAEQVYLHDLFVDPGTRNGGVGRKLIEHVYAYAKEEGMGHVYWHTQYFNHRAQLLYTKVAERTDFVVYQKNL